MADYIYTDINISKYFEDQKKNKNYKKYKEEINNIYNKYKKSKEILISDRLLFDKLFIKFYEFCNKYVEEWKDAYLKKGKGDETETISLIDILLDKLKVAIETYKDDIGDFFSYTLMLIEREIENKTKHEQPLPVNKTDYKKLMQAAAKLKIDIYGHKNKINFEDIQMLAQEMEFSMDKVKDILTKLSLNCIYSTDFPIQNDKEEHTFGNSIENENDKLNVYEIEKKHLIYKQLALINDLYSIYRTKKQSRYVNKLKPILVNYFIKQIIRNTDKQEIDKYTKEKNINNEYFDKEQIFCLLKQFKFYDENDNNIKEIMEYFFKTNKVKTQKELAKMLNVNGEWYISEIENDFTNVLSNATVLLETSEKDNKEIVEEVAKDI